MNSSLAPCAHLHTAVFAHECEYFLSRHDTAMSSRTASSDIRQVDLLLVHATNWYAAEATLRSVTELHQAGTEMMTIPYRYICAYSSSNGKGIPFWVFKLNDSFYFHSVLLTV